MNYKANGHNYNIPNEELDKLMDKLDISLAEACELYLSDHEIVEDETVEELTKKAQKNRVTTTIHDAKGEKKERKAREKKENPLKKDIILALFEGLNGYFGHNGEIFIRNDEKYIDISFEGREFTVNLVEHRKKKGE